MRSDDLNFLKTIDFIEWNRFNGKTVYVTGATGLIGSTIVNTLISCSKAKVVVQVRNEEKARKLFENKVEYIVCDLLKNPSYSPPINYIIHCANPTSSKFFVKNPVETIKTAISGTMNVLEFARQKAVDGFVFLSTMEVYGTPEKGHKVKETEGGSFDTAVVRNCYPLSKQICESLCASYAAEYGLHTMVVRLTQTFGPGVSYDDGRVFAEFARCAIERKNILLRTKGETERNYLYTIDAVTAILTVLLKGRSGENYTAANEETFCSIYEMAQIVADLSGVKVVVEEQDISSFGYANTLHMDLDTSKLRGLGWRAERNLKNMFSILIEDMRRNK